MPVLVHYLSGCQTDCGYRPESLSILKVTLTAYLKSYHHCLSGMFTITAYLGCQTDQAYLGIKVIMFINQIELK